MPGREGLQLVHGSELPPLAHPNLPLIDGSLALKIDQISPLAVSPDLQLVSNPIEAPTMLVNADAVSELIGPRQKAAQEFTTILAYKRQLLDSGETHKVAPTVDALGMAKLTVAAKRQFGVNSPEYRESRAGLRLDSARLIYEAASKNEPEHFEELLRTFNDGHYYSHGRSLSDMAVNGISPSAHPEEIAREGMELKEERTYEALGAMIGRLGLQGAIERVTPLFPAEVDYGHQKPSIDVTTISQVADYARDEYAANPKSSHSGYAASPDVLKLMIRRSHFRDDTGDRFDEVAAVLGKYINPELISEVVAEIGAIPEGTELSKTDGVGTQMVGVNSGRARELVKLLDQRAGAKYGVNLFWGKEVSADHPKDYVAFEEQAKIRQKKLEPMPDQLADMLEVLEEAGTDNRVAAGMVDKFLKKKLLELAATRPELAAVMFDQATADGFREVARLKQAGRFMDAQKLEDLVKSNAPEVTFCGGGGGANCGVEDINPNSAAGHLAKELGLRGSIMRNTTTACTNCGEMELVHDYNGNTACLGCKSTKLNGKGVKHADPQAKKPPKPAVKLASVISLSERREKNAQKQATKVS